VKVGAQVLCGFEEVTSLKGARWMYETFLPLGCAEFKGVCLQRLIRHRAPTVVLCPIMFRLTRSFADFRFKFGGLGDSEMLQAQRLSDLTLEAA